MEIIAFACLAMGFAIYIAFDTGLIRYGKSSDASSEAKALAELERPDSRLARIKSLQDRIDITETKLKERVEVLEKMNLELHDFAKRLGSERKALNTMATMVFEIENERQKIVKERGVLTIGAGRGGQVDLPVPLAGVAAIARKAGVLDEKIASVKWRDHIYLRLVDAFEFQEGGIYLRMPGLEKATVIANAVGDDHDVSRITVVYRDQTVESRAPASSDETDADENLSTIEEVGRERALVLRNHFRNVLGNDFNVKVSKIDNSLVEPGAVEVWVGSD